MDIYQLIDSLEEILEKSAAVPLSGKRLVSVGEAVEIIRQMRLSIPDEIKEAARLNSDREGIIAKAEADAQRIVKDAEEQYAKRMDDNAIISDAYKQAGDIVAAAQESARGLKDEAYEYIGKLIEKMEDGIYETIETLNSNRREIEGFRGQREARETGGQQ